MANTNTFKVKVTGTSYENRQSKIWYLRKNAANAYVTLNRNPQNPADPNAIAVIAHVKGQRAFRIGYIPANVAAVIAPVIDQNTARPWIEGFETIVTTRNGKKWIMCNIIMRLIPAPAPAYVYNYSK